MLPPTDEIAGTALAGYTPQVVWARQHQNGRWLIVQYDPQGYSFIRWQIDRTSRGRHSGALVGHYWQCPCHILFGYAVQEWNSPTSYDTPRIRRDSQRKRAYQWESEALDLWDDGICPKLPWDQIEALAKTIFTDLNLKQPKLTFSERIHGAECRGSGRELVLGHNTARKRILLHEIAHAVVSLRSFEWFSYDTLEAHGPEWVATYMELLHRYDGLDLNSLRASARAYDVKYSERGMCWTR